MTMKHQQRPPTSKIPDFANREEETLFWETHDFTEFLDETQPVRLRVGKNLTQGLTVRLDREDREELEQWASEQGIGPSTLVRMWIKEQLRQHRSSAASS